MPPVHTIEQTPSASQGEPLTPNALFPGPPAPDFQAPDFQLSAGLLSFTFPEHSPSPSSSAPRKKRSHGKARPPGHIPRPPNAFIIFRTEYIKSMATHSTPEMSRNLGSQWKQMSPLEKRPWVEKAHHAKEAHMKQYPGYKYKPVHPRDAEGRCIRKRRKQNQPRAKTAPYGGAQDLFVPSGWKEGRGDAELQAASLPSDQSTASSPPPPPSPSPGPSTFYPKASYSSLRRSSSVPLPGCDEKKYFGTGPEQSDATYLPPEGGPQMAYVSRKFAKRPSTSMDFTCAGPMPEYGHSGNNIYLAPQSEISQLRPSGHRRSISAPMFGGDISTAQFVDIHNQGSSFRPDLTPINPIFSNVFDKFSWDTQTAEMQYPATIVPPQHPYTGLDIPAMTHSPSNGSVTPPAATPDVSPSTPYRPRVPIVQHPAPIPRFDFSAFESQFGEFDVVSLATSNRAPMAQDSELRNALGPAPPLYQSYVDHAELGQQFYPVEPQQEVLQYREEAQPPSMASPQTSYALPVDISGYEEGLRYTEPTQSLNIDELIIEGY